MIRLARERGSVVVAERVLPTKFMMMSSDEEAAVKRLNLSMTKSAGFDVRKISTPGM